MTLAALVALTAIFLIFTYKILSLQVTERENLRTSYAKEVSELCQRIQAPEAAVIAQQIAESPVSPQAVDVNDDEDFWEHKEALDKIAAIEARGLT